MNARASGRTERFYSDLTRAACHSRAWPSAEAAMHAVMEYVRRHNETARELVNTRASRKVETA